MVAYIFLGYKVWIFLFEKKLIVIYYILLVCVAFFGVIASVGLIWKLLDVFSAILIIINLSAFLYNGKKLHREFLKDEQKLSF